MKKFFSKKAEPVFSSIEGLQDAVNQANTTHVAFKDIKAGVGVVNNSISSTSGTILQTTNAVKEIASTLNRWLQAARDFPESSSYAVLNPDKTNIPLDINVSDITDENLQSTLKTISRGAKELVTWTNKEKEKVVTAGYHVDDLRKALEKRQKQDEGTSLLRPGSRGSGRS